MHARRKGCARFAITALAALTGLCLVLAGISAVINNTQPTHSSVVERLSEIDKARLAEAIHLRQSLGESILPGWSRADIPVILYNEQYLFLVGLPEPAKGWVTVPGGKQMGLAWEPVPGDLFYGAVYYRQKMQSPGQNTQAFTVRVGDRWVASLSTLEWTRIAMANEVREVLPAPLQAVAPVSLWVNLLVPGSDTHASLVLHETIHAYQGMYAESRLVAAERASTAAEAYPWEETSFIDAWQVELDLLAQALRAGSDQEDIDLARQFLAQRAQRRSAANLPDELITFERQREWEEGIAKYGELSIAVQAASAEDYQPLPEMDQDSEFHHYQNARQKWDQEIDQIRRMAGAEGDGRFYYSGFAQAVLLDRLAPGWKEDLLDEGVWLEDLLSAALLTP